MPPGASIATLNQLCATKFRVSQPDAFGLFLYKEQNYHRLQPGALAHKLPTDGYLVYRRAERPGTPGTAAEEAVSGRPVSGSQEEEKGGQGDEDVEAKASPRDSGEESETTAEQGEGQVGGNLVHREPEAAGARQQRSS